MPHLTLEYTGNVRPTTGFDELLGQLHQILVDEAGIPLANCKSRALRLETYGIADGGPAHAFVHLTIRFLAGRPLACKQAIGRQALAVLARAFGSALAEFELQISVEIQDIDRAAYFKIPEGTL